MTETMEWIDDIKRLHEEKTAQLSRQWLEQCRQEAPYCILPQLFYLKQNGLKGNEDVLEQLAINHPDRMALAAVLDKEGYALNNFYPPQEKPETPDTITTIDRFLDNYGKTSPAEVEAISRAIFNPQPDYADVLAAQDQQQVDAQATGGDAQDELISKFIAEQMQLGEQAAHTPITAPVGEQEKAEIADETIDNPSLEDDTMLTESLAKMYIARHKYPQALEIIKRLNLKYPEKSIYFADQIRFLTKLVLNETLNAKK